MAALYEYVIALIWGEDDHVDALPEEEADSLDDDSISGMASTAGITSGSRLVIRKSCLAAKQSQAFKAVPSMVIKDPEPQDNYDARVVAIMLVPTGVFTGILGTIMTILSYTTLVGFAHEDSAAHAIFGFHVRVIGPITIGFAACCEILALIAVLCTPHSRTIPMIYPQEDEDDIDHTKSSTRRVSIAPTAFSVAQSPSTTSPAEVIAPGSKLTVLPSARTVV